MEALFGLVWPLEDPEKKQKRKIYQWYCNNTIINDIIVQMQMLLKQLVSKYATMKRTSNSKFMQLSTLEEQMISK